MPSDVASDPAWLRLRDATDALRLLEDGADASLLADADRAVAAGLVATMQDALVALAPRFPHETEYLAAVRADLGAWVEGGFGRPDFTAALAAFHPEQRRVDGTEHLVVFPQYTPNGSQDRRFEALILRGPWPAFVAELEAERFDNRAFVPVELVDSTAGYDSECVVVFPETVVVAGAPANAYGAILCDRESRRFMRSTRRASEILRLTLPPELAALASSYDLARDTYILWDLIHDRWHSHGDLPFDPFMIRQRLPFWMYSLEELRVDLATFADARGLADEGFPFARYVMYAIVLDRILRFPITGDRVRNYDGLGGQLLFAWLHGQDAVRWTDNRLEIDWDALPAAVEGLKEQVDALYRSGIDRSKVSYWAAAHDLIAAHVQPNVASAWRADRRQVADEAEPRRWIDAVLDDEFPLSLFYVALKEKCEALAAAERAAA